MANAWQRVFQVKRINLKLRGSFFCASCFWQRADACFPWQWPCGSSLFAGPLRRTAPAHIWHTPHTSAVAFCNNDLEAPSGPFKSRGQCQETEKEALREVGEALNGKGGFACMQLNFYALSFALRGHDFISGTKPSVVNCYPRCIEMTWHGIGIWQM